MLTSSKVKDSLILGAGFLLRECVPHELKRYIRSLIFDQIHSYSSQLTVVVNESDGNSYPNCMYKAIESYLSTSAVSAAASNARVFRASLYFDVDDDEPDGAKAGEDWSKPVNWTIEPGQKVVDFFEGIKFIWQLNIRETQRSPPSSSCRKSGGYYYSSGSTDVRSFNLTFHKKHKETVYNKYFLHILNRSKVLEEESRTLKLYTNSENVRWSPATLCHPATFDTVAMDEGKKQALIDDLVRFVERKEYYKRIGKAWKRGYLFYGPPGTGKSTLIAAMANFLKFDIYDLELTEVRSNAELRSLVMSTTSRSIIVIEDIDSVQHQRERITTDSNYDSDYDDYKITLSGLLNTIDGLWSSYQDERIIIFTTNYKDRLDAALLRPGRMDMHIYMGYCNPAGFRTLASNYHSLTEHKLFEEIEGLIKTVEITPARVAETLMRAENAGLVDVLKEKKMEDGISQKKMEAEKKMEVEKKITEEVSIEPVKKNCDKGFVGWFFLFLIFVGFLMMGIHLYEGF